MAPGPSEHGGFIGCWSFRQRNGCSGSVNLRPSIMAISFQCTRARSWPLFARSCRCFSSCWALPLPRFIQPLCAHNPPFGGLLIEGTDDPLVPYDGGAVVIGGGHTWPSGKQYLPPWVVGKVNREIDGATEISAFFRKLR